MQGRIMKPKIATLVLAALLASASVCAEAHYHHGPNVRFGVVMGGPLWYGPGYYAPYYYPPYYYPPSYYPSLPASPPVYIERGEMQPAAPPQESYWYYCAEAKGYYPYVKECPGGWERVSPQPPPPPNR